MSSTATVERPEEQTEAAMMTLEAKFGKVIMEDNFTAIPNRIIDRFHQIGITPTEFVFWVTIVRFQYGEAPAWPSIERIAETMGRHTRTVIRYIKRMEEKGMLTVIRGEPNAQGASSNHYDFTPMYDKIAALYPYTETNLLTNNKNGKSENEPGKPSSKKVGDNVSRTSNKNDDTKLHGNTTKMLTRVSAEMSPEEDESKEDESQKDTSNLRGADAQNKKGTVLNGSSNPSPQQPSNETSTSNQTINNKPNKQSNRNTETENTQPQSNAAAPPAWSNVPKEAVPPLPTYAAHVIEGISRQFHDLAPKSSMTIAARMYQELAPYGADEYSFGEIAGYAKSDANKANVKKQNPDGTINRMPYFFKMLRKNIDHNIAIWAEEAEEDRKRAEEVEQQSNNEGS